MKKILLSIFFLCFLVKQNHAQSVQYDDSNQLKKIYIAIAPFTKSEGVPEQAIEKAYNAFMDAITTNKRFELLDFEEIEKIQAEYKASNAETGQRSLKLQSGHSISAAYHISGNVTDYKSYGFDKKSKIFQAYFKVQIRLFNSITGKVIYSELVSPRNSPFKPLSSKSQEKWLENPLDFEAKKGKLFSYPTAQRALEDIEKQMLSESKLFIENMLTNVFPIYLKVYGVRKATGKGVPLEIEILGGTSAYITEKDVLKLVEETVIQLNEKESTRKYTELGFVKVIKVEGESFSVAKITKGNKNAIGQKLSNNAILKVVK